MTTLTSTRPPASPAFTAVQRQWLDVGYWSAMTLADALEAALQRHPSGTVDVWSPTRPRHTTYRDILDGARRFAHALRTLGVHPGDRVLIQLPNWIEFLICFTGALFAGAVVVPLAPFYSSRERNHAVAEAQPKVLVLATRFHNRDFLAEALDEPDPASAVTMFVGDGVPADHLRFADVLDAHEPVPRLEILSPSDIAVLTFTSGTTGHPKGVLLSHRSLYFESTRHGPLVLPQQAPALTASPLGHISGLISGFLVPALRGEAIHLIDQWSPTLAATAAGSAGLSVGNGAPVFLQSLTEWAGFDGELLRNTTSVSLGGASISPSFCERVQRMGIDVIRVYGSTEHPASTGSTVTDPADKRVMTDGRALPGVELRIVGPDDSALASGQPGELWTRGPDACDGYLDASATAETFTADGWIRTGDIGVLDDDGWLTIVDRKKDIIIRQGLNISAREVELAIAEHPGVVEVAVIGRPDGRTGERVVAAIRQQEGTPDLGVADLGAALAAIGLAKFKWPEEVVRMTDLPRTPSGKIAKARLRAVLPGDPEPPISEL